MDRARCVKCHKLGHWAREYTASWDSSRSAYSGTTFTPGYSYSPYRPSNGAHTPVQSSNVFDEEVADIAQVHCNSELFEFELSISPPCVNVKGNLRRNVEFWKHIGTPSFILNVMERGYLLPVVSFPEQAVFTEKQQIFSFTLMPSLLKRLFKT